MDSYSDTSSDVFDVSEVSNSDCAVDEDDFDTDNFTEDTEDVSNVFTAEIDTEFSEKIDISSSDNDEKLMEDGDESSVDLHADSSETVVDDSEDADYDKIADSVNEKTYHELDAPEIEIDFTEDGDLLKSASDARLVETESALELEEVPENESIQQPDSQVEADGTAHIDSSLNSEGIKSEIVEDAIEDGNADLMEDGTTPKTIEEDELPAAIKDGKQLIDENTAKEDSEDSELTDWERTSLTQNEEVQMREMDESGEIEIPAANDEMEDPVHSVIHLPNVSGEFSGERGNSEFRPLNTEVLEALGKYSRETVEYKEGYPDFSPFTTHSSPWGDVDCQVEIGHMTDQRENPSWAFGNRPKGSGHDPAYDLGNFAQADNSLLVRLQATHPDVTIQDVVTFRKDNQLIWHECADGKTMQLVPRIIHDACRHSGGVSEMKYRMAYGNVELPY